jgi:IclR family transcriptional regulator, pca regulon regulatory protein
MARRDNPDFVEAIERGLEVIRAFGGNGAGMSLTEVAEATGLPRPTARRVLVTLESLGYVRMENRVFRLTTRVLDLGVAYVASLDVWDVVRPHLQVLVGRTHESSSMAQLDGGEIVYVGRVAVPKIVTIAVNVGTRMRAASTSMGRVLLADLPPAELAAALAAEPRGDVIPRSVPDPERLEQILAETRERGWTIVDQELAVGVRSVAAPVRDHEGRTVAAVNICVQAAEHSMEELREAFLPQLLETATAISAELGHRAHIPQVVLPV